MYKYIFLFWRNILVAVLLPDIGEAGEDEHPHDDHEAEEPELLVRVLERGAECLEARDVAAEAEDPEDPHDPEDLGHPPHLVLVLPGALHVAQGQGDEVGHDPEQVDHVHPLLEELPLVGRGDAPDQVLDGEPGDEDGLGDGKVSVLVGLIRLRIRHLK